MSASDNYAGSSRVLPGKVWLLAQGLRNIRENPA